MVRGFRRWLLYDRPGPFLRHEPDLLHPHAAGWRTYLPLITFLAVTIVLIPVSQMVTHSFVFEPVAVWTADAALRRAPKLHEALTRTVLVSKEDHRAMFDAQSPLPAAAIIRAVCALTSRGPAVVAVDLGTSDIKGWAKCHPLPVFPAPVIWGADVEEIVASSGGNTEAQYRVVGPLGQRSPWPEHWGVAVVPSTFDGIVRQWSKQVAVQGGSKDSLAWAAITVYCRDPKNSARCKGLSDKLHDPVPLGADIDFFPLTIGMYAAPPPLCPCEPASSMAPAATQPTEAMQCPKRDADPALAGRIVFLGGQYSSADRHDTPWGKRDGVNLHAMAVESAFRPGQQSHFTSTAFKILFKFALALVIAATYHWLRPIPAAILTLIFLPIAVLLSGALMHFVGDYEIGVIPFIIGVLLEQQVTASERAQHRSFAGTT